MPRNTSDNRAAKVTGGRQQPRYTDVAEALVAEISDGRYEVGQKLQTELELCSRFGVSRSTIRQALGELEAAGLVQRRQGSGTTLVAVQPAVRYSLALASETDVLRYASETVLEIDGGAVAVPIADSRRLRLGDATQWVYFKGVRRAGGPGLPLGLTKVYVPSAYSPAIEKLGRRAQRAIFLLLVEHYQLVVAAIEQHIFASVLDEEEADALMAQPGTPALVIVRRYSSHEGLIEVSENIHPADRFSYEMRLEREASARPTRARQPGG